MKVKATLLLISLLSTLLCSCIFPYEHPGSKNLEKILVVEGTITQGTTVIELRYTTGILEDIKNTRYLNDAKVKIERNDGFIYMPITPIPVSKGYYAFTINNLDPESEYRLVIEHRKNIYRTGFMKPIMTPEISELSFKKAGKGESVLITVSTEDPDDNSKYYMWRYDEIWEFTASLYATGDLILIGPEDEDYEEDRVKYDTVYWDQKKGPFNPKFYCWGYSSKGLILDQAVSKEDNFIKDKVLIEKPASDNRFSIMYNIKVYQNQISKNAFEYYANIKKNSEDMGGIFSPIPAEMKGNVVCITEPDTPVIGYVDVSYTTTKEFLGELTELYEAPEDPCLLGELHEMHSSMKTVPSGYGVYLAPGKAPTSMPPIFAPKVCLDCRYRGNKNKPDGWPTDSE